MSRANPRFRRPQTPLPAPTTNLYKVVFSGTVQNQEWIWSLYYNDSQAMGAPSAQSQLLGAAETTISGPVMGVFATDVILNRLEVMTLNKTTLAPIVKNIVPIPGTIAGTSKGSILAMPVGRRSDFRSKCGRGYINLPISTTFTTAPGDNILNAAGITAQQNFANLCFLAPLVAGALTFTPQVVSHGTRTAPGVLGTATVTGATTSLVIGTVRRRKLGRGK